MLLYEWSPHGAIGRGIVDRVEWIEGNVKGQIIATCLPSCGNILLEVIN